MVVSNHRQRRIPVNPRDYYQNGYYPGAPVSCRSPFKFAKINFNGDVLLCHKFVVGNIYRSSFPDIWFGKEAARVRAGVTMPGNEKTCHTCHHYRFCVKAGEIDTREAENFRALSNSGRMKVTDQKVDDGTPILVGTVGLHSVFQWDGVYHAVPFERYQAEAGDCRPLMLDGAISGPGSVTSDNYEKVTRGLLVYAIRDSAVKLVLHTAKRVIRRLRKAVA